MNITTLYSARNAIQGTENSIACTVFQQTQIPPHNLMPKENIWLAHFLQFNVNFHKIYYV